MFDKLQQSFLLPDAPSDIRKYGINIPPSLVEHISMQVQDPEEVMKQAIKYGKHLGNVVVNSQGKELKLLGEVPFLLELESMMHPY